MQTSPIRGKSIGLVVIVRYYKIKYMIECYNIPYTIFWSWLVSNVLNIIYLGGGSTHIQTDVLNYSYKEGKKVTKMITPVKVKIFSNHCKYDNFLYIKSRNPYKAWQKDQVNYMLEVKGLL